MHRHPAVRLLWCLFGAACGIALALYVVGPPHNPFVLASLGGTSVFLFGLTRAPATQLRALVGGHVGTAAIGIACAQFLGSSLVAYAAAVSLSLAYMLITRTVHPPAGANPVIMVYAQASWATLLNPVLLGIACLVIVAVPPVSGPGPVPGIALGAIAAFPQLGRLESVSNNVGVMSGSHLVRSPSIPNAHNSKGSP